MQWPLSGLSLSLLSLHSRRPQAECLPVNMSTILSYNQEINWTLKVSKQTEIYYLLDKYVHFQFLKAKPIVAHFLTADEPEYDVT